MINSMDQDDLESKTRLFTKRVIITNGSPLLVRYTIFRFPSLGLYIHKLCKSDHDRALHDHPWWFLSFVIRGYDEVMDDGIKSHGFGDILYRPATWKHRVIVPENRPAWTVIFVGRRTRRWGFWQTIDKWCWWRKYDTEKAICEE